MKVAVLSESPADEAAIRILVEGILGRRTQTPALSSFRTRAPGISGVFRSLPTVLRELHYNLQDTEGLIVVVDSYHAPVHSPEHDEPGGADEKCHLCKLRQIADQAMKQLRPIPNRPSLKTAFGIATPAVEAWYQCGRDPHVTEAAWIIGLQSNSFPYTKNGLKQDVYGTDRPSLVLETQRATEEAERLAQDLSTLEQLFPAGFGSLARDVRNW